MGMLAISPLLANETVEKLGVRKGIVCVAGLPDGGVDSITSLAADSEFQIYFQSADSDEVLSVQKAAEDAGLLGSRIFAGQGSLDSLHLADNIADAVIVNDETPDAELLRILRPRASAWIGDRQLTKPVPEGTDEWTHPYHGPDNNPNSTDQQVKGKFRTQFIADPKFSPMPEQTVIGGGRIYKAMGHIAHKANQNPMLNTLLCVNAYNGTILWTRELPKGFMIHRNTMIATDDGLLMGDHESCKFFDGDTGEMSREITIPADITDGQTWKWMAHRDGVLYALVGNPEVKIETQKSIRRGLGHWPWGMWDGHDYDDPRTSFGYGRTLVAIDLKSGNVLWNFRDKEFLDARAVCMNDEFIYCFSPGKVLMAVKVEDGKLVWKNQDKDLLAAIGDNSKAQHYVTGYATTCYIKCTNDHLFFAGPQREEMAVATAKDGKLAWTYPAGNLQLVLRDDGVWAAGSQKGDGGVKLDYASGKILAEMPARRACTRATGGVDSIFFRASGGTVRILTDTNTAQHIAPMRPPCQDGVLISNGQLYWGPWMCGCQLSLYGNISLAPAPETAAPTGDEIYAKALTQFDGAGEVAALDIAGDDWTRFRGDDSRSDSTDVALPTKGVELAWNKKLGSGDLVTAPVAGGGLVFVADRNGVVQALDAKGESVWKSYTGGPVYYSPVISQDRLFVGAGDGKVYAYEAASGRLLWTFQVGPDVRLIPIFEKLVSAWPLAGGVVVDEESGTLYAAGGITHYDGTYVVALDAKTGELKASNTTSGTLSSEVDSGISMQGNVHIAGDELRFLGGGIYETARYDLKTLECLNEVRVDITSQFRTAFYPYYPDYAKYVSLDHTRDDGTVLCHDTNYGGYLFDVLQLQEAPANGRPRLPKDAAREFLRRRGQIEKPTTRWADVKQRRFTSFVVSGDHLLATGHPDEKPDEAFLVATNIFDGSDLWKEKLPAVAVKGGTAVDSEGRIFVVLESGEMLCFKGR